ncbi:MAG: alpha/beta hydrolase [Elainella sp. Prado103]|jgi:pimeloyl-ACP methyl ester carboxylesterase|nr:alpha/beta hydrolase [Elainella sp. Prado103]
MTTRFLSLPLDRLTEATSIALAQQIQLAEVQTPLSPVPITTALVHCDGACDGACDGDNASVSTAQTADEQTPIVMLHGFDSSVFEFRRLLPLLAATHPVWAIDLLGFGFTDRSIDLAFSPAAIKTHLYYTWKTLIGKPMVLVGASMGGAAAIDFALSYPEAVQQLVLIDSAGFTAGPALGKYLIAPLGYLATAFLRNLKVRQNISLKAYHDPSFASPDALSCAALHLDRIGWRQALIAFTRSGGYGSFQQQLPQLRMPTLIVWGRCDRILGTTDAERFQQAIPNSQLVWIEACGHVPHLESPQTTANRILEFIGLSGTGITSTPIRSTPVDPHSAIDPNS